MEFKTVYKVDGLLKDGEENSFLEKKELEKLVQSTEEYKVLYFLRESNYLVLHDFPCLGAMRTVFSSSSVKGPFALPPQIKKKSSCEYFADIIKKFIPSNEVPKSFEEIELREYGIQTDPEIARAILPCEDMINCEKVKEIGKSALERLREISKNSKEITTKFGTTYTLAFIDDCLVKFNYSEIGFYYPRMDVEILSAKGRSQEIVEKLGIHLGEIFKRPFTYNELLKRCIKRGLAYNFSIGDVKDFSEIEKLGNIIL